MEQVIFRILDDGTEDLTGIWEIVDYFSAHTHSEKIVKAKEVLTVLSECGLIELYIGKQFSGEEQLIHPDQTYKQLNDNRFWEIDNKIEPEQDIRFKSTERGEKLLFCATTIE